MKRLLVLLPAAAALLVPMAHAADPPPLKEGLWEIRGQSIENPGGRKTDFTFRLCRSHAYDKAMDAQVKNVKGCKTSFDAVGGGRFTSASRCEVEGTTVISNGTFTYESPTSTRSESHATYDPALHGKTDETVIQDQMYIGECPKGMNPGDRVTAEGSLQRYSR
jgi:hypothetical protein